MARKRLGDRISALACRCVDFSGTSLATTGRVLRDRLSRIIIGRREAMQLCTHQRVELAVTRNRNQSATRAVIMRAAIADIASLPSSTSSSTGSLFPCMHLKNGKFRNHSRLVQQQGADSPEAFPASNYTLSTLLKCELRAQNKALAVLPGKLQNQKVQLLMHPDHAHP